MAKASCKSQQTEQDGQRLKAEGQNEMPRSKGGRRTHRSTGQAGKARYPMKQTQVMSASVNPEQSRTDQKKGTHFRKPEPNVVRVPLSLFESHAALASFVCHANM